MLNYTLTKHDEGNVALQCVTESGNGGKVEETDKSAP